MPDADGSGPTALVVEDDEQIAFLLKFILEREGFAVTLARDGASAKAHLQSLAPPAVVTLDVMLPQVDGFELLKAMRAQRGWETVPILMLSAKSLEADVVRGLETGANDYIVKPFKPDELRARIRRLVKSK